MKKLTPLKLALTFAGCFLGAGYVSGQELWQFFGVFGLGGYFGLVLAMAFLFAVAAALTGLARRTGVYEPDKLVVGFDVKALRGVMMGLELVFLFGIGTIMTAGVGALLNQLFGLPSWLGSAAFAAAVAVIAIFGLRGMVSAFSVSVPILAAATLIFGLVSLSRGGFSALPETVTSGPNPMMPVWFVGAITFSCYNIFGNFAVLSPLSRYIPDRKTALAGIGLGALLLLCIALGVMVSVSGMPSSLSAQLPMLALAGSMSPWLGIMYGVLLLMAMFGTSLSSEVAFMDFVCAKSEKLSAGRRLLIAAYAVLTFIGSLEGFGGLIATVYPVFGYCSSVFVALLAVHCVRDRKARKIAESSAVS
jgi:uncharacterized membrane protein YkvI